MAPTYVNSVADKVTNNALTLINPTWQGGDLLLAVCSSLDATITVAGYTDIDRNVGSGTPGLLGFVARKFAAGSLGGSSTDSGANVIFNPAVLGAGHKTSGAVIGFRGVDQSAPINAHAFIVATGTTSFTGHAVTTTKDGCTIVSVFVDKDSTDGLAATPAAGWTVKASAVFPTSTGKANLWIATRDSAPNAGSVGDIVWSTNAAPGSVQIFTVALAPVSTTQTIVPMGDGDMTGETGVPTDTAGNKYTNLNKTPEFTKGIQLNVDGEATIKLTSLSEPDTFTGFSVGYSVGPAAGATSTNWQLKLIQDPDGAATVHDTWTQTGVTTGTAYTHAIASGDADDIAFTSGKANDLALYVKLTAAS